MTEDRQKKTETGKSRRRLSRLRLVLIGVVVIIIVCCLTWQGHLWNFRSIDEQLAAIEAARAIPDAEIGVFQLRTKP